MWGSRSSARGCHGGPSSSGSAMTSAKTSAGDARRLPRAPGSGLERLPRPRRTRTPSRCLPLLFLLLLYTGLVLLPQGVQCVRQIRERVRERVVLAEATGEVNPRVDNMEFDPLLEELEEQEDDKKWMENYKRTHDMWAGVGAGELPHIPMEGQEEGELLGGGVLEEAEEVIEEALAGVEADFEDMAAMEAQPDFLYDDHFNITDRIIQLFPLIDVAPADGQLSREELTAWHVELGKKASVHRTQREMQAADANSDGHAALQEALSGMGVGDPNDPANEDLRAMYTERFHLADTNNDSLLNMTEFHDFLHPEESDNDGLRLSLLRDEMTHRDLDSDGKISLSEFEMTTHHELEQQLGEHPDPHEAMEGHWEDEGGDGGEDGGSAAKEESVRKHFDKVDLNKDGLIDAEEFRPMLKHLWPSQKEFATAHAKDILEQADRGGDGFLTLQEMLNHPHAFYQTVEDHENEPVHDEF